LLSIDFSNDMKEMIDKHNLKKIQKEYEKDDIDGFDVVIVAIDDIDRQKEIYLEAKQKGILCNTVDVVEYCDFIFPSYIKKGDLIISISTSGASPAVAKYLRRYIEKLIPQNLDKFLAELKDLRKKLPKGKERMKLFEEKVKKFFEEKNR